MPPAPDRCRNRLPHLPCHPAKSRRSQLNGLDTAFGQGVEPPHPRVDAAVVAHEDALGVRVVSIHRELCTLWVDS